MVDFQGLYVASFGGQHLTRFSISKMSTVKCHVGKRNPVSLAHVFINSDSGLQKRSSTSLNLYSPYLTHCSSPLLAESPLNHKSLHHQTYSVGRWFLLSYHQVYLQGLQGIWFPLHTSISTKKHVGWKSFFRSLWFSLGCVRRGGRWNRLHCKNIISFTMTSRENWLFLL